MTNGRNLTMSVGRDYRTSTRYEFVIYEGDLLLHREGCFTTASAARRAGIKAAAKLTETDTEIGRRERNAANQLAHFSGKSN